MISSFIPGSLCIIGLLALASGSCAVQAGSAPSSLDDLWSLAEQRLGAQALAGLESAPPKASADLRERRLLEALCQFQAQPRTEARLRAARDILLNLKDSAAASDPVTQIAAFFLARYHEEALPEPDPAAARAAYHALYAESPGTLVGQLALARVALLDLAAPSSRSGRLAAYANLDGWDGRFTHPLARRDYHLVMALTGLRYGADPASIIRHVEQACATGLLRVRTQADLLLGGAAMADRANRHGLAREWRERFLKENPSDPRVVLVRKILKGEVAL